MPSACVLGPALDPSPTIAIEGTRLEAVLEAVVRIEWEWRFCEEWLMLDYRMIAEYNGIVQDAESPRDAELLGG